MGSPPDDNVFSDGIHEVYFNVVDPIDSPGAVNQSSLREFLPISRRKQVLNQSGKVK
jgi:hypothetical protein